MDPLRQTLAHLGDRGEMFDGEVSLSDERVNGVDEFLSHFFFFIIYETVSETHIHHHL
jgi:hypothetical protein